MWCSRMRPLAAIIVAGAVMSQAACRDDLGPNQFSFRKALTILPGSLPDTTDEYVPMPTHSDKLATRVLRFGGMFVDGTTLSVQIAGAELTSQEEAAARGTIETYLDSIDRTELSVQFVPANYTFIQFRIWENRLNQIAELNIHTMGLDERNNRLMIRVASSEEEEDVESVLPYLGIPTNAVDLQVKAPGDPAATTKSSFRPTYAGTQIAIKYGPSGGSVNTCTFGFQAQTQQFDGNDYFLTNAHCVQDSGPLLGYTGQNVYQPTYSLFSLIGVNVYNPSFVSGLPGCPTGDICRWSDAALIEQNVNAHFERIIQPNNRVVTPGTAGDTNVSSTTYIGLDTGIFVPIVGDTLEKVGMTTGWTAGPVSQVCVLFSYFDGSRLCSVIVDASSWFGDSGSPVFRRSWDGSVWRYKPVGILFATVGFTMGTSYYYSPLSGVATDFSGAFSLVYAR